MKNGLSVFVSIILFIGSFVVININNKGFDFETLYSNLFETKNGFALIIFFIIVASVICLVKYSKKKELNSKSIINNSTQYNNEDMDSNDINKENYISNNICNPVVYSDKTIFNKDPNDRGQDDELDGIVCDKYQDLDRNGKISYYLIIKDLTNNDSFKIKVNLDVYNSNMINKKVHITRGIKRNIKHY